MNTTAVCANCKYYRLGYRGDDYPCSQQCTHPKVRRIGQPHHISGDTIWPYPDCEDINKNGDCQLFKKLTLIDSIFWKHAFISCMIIFMILISITTYLFRDNLPLLITCGTFITLLYCFVLPKTGP